MKNSCLNCAKAKWKVTAAGRLHPNGSGVCVWKYPDIKIPKAFYWVSGIVGGPKPSGGFIDRKTPQIDCPLFHPKESP